MIKARVTTKIKGDKEYNHSIGLLSKIKNSYVTVGVHEDAGKYSNGVSVFEVALWNEFGTEKNPSRLFFRIPPRPFFRTVIYGKENLINQWRQDLLKQIITGKTTVEKALATIGFRVKELVKNQIGANTPPSNAPSTLAHKKREGVAPRTLMETTLLLRSIDFRVVVK